MKFKNRSLVSTLWFLLLICCLITITFRASAQSTTPAQPSVIAAPTLTLAPAPTDTPSAVPFASPLATNLLSGLQNVFTSVNKTDFYWTSNNLTLWQAAVMHESTPGNASSIGQDIGLEIPIHKYNIAPEISFREDQLLGDFVHVQAGVQYQWVYYSLELSGGAAGRYELTDSKVRFVPMAELKQATSKYSAIFTRWSYPVQKHGGWGELDAGLALRLGKNW